MADLWRNIKNCYSGDYGPSKRTEIEIYPPTTGNRIIEIDTFDKSISSVDHWLWKRKDVEKFKKIDN